MAEQKTARTKSRHAGRFALLLLAISLQVLMPAASKAEGRDNPFLPTTTAAEDAEINKRNEIIKTVRGLIPQLSEILQKRMDGQKQALIDQVLKEAGQIHGAAAPAKMAANLRLIACSGNKAIYRDAITHETIVYKSGDPAAPSPSPCDGD